MIQNCQTCFYYDKDYAIESIFIRCDKTGLNCHSFIHNYNPGDIVHISGFGLDESLIKVNSFNGKLISYSHRIGITKTEINTEDFSDNPHMPDYNAVWAVPTTKTIIKEFSNKSNIDIDWIYSFLNK